MGKTTVVKFPLDILKNLQKEYPDFSNPARIRIVYNEYVEMKQLKAGMNKAGEIIYGKGVWNKKFKK